MDKPKVDSAKVDNTDAERDAAFIVLRNDEEQYSLWPAHKSVPAGWRAVTPPRSKADCLAYVDEVWVDMRPLSLRQQSSQA
jgi:MbtH protein